MTLEHIRAPGYKTEFITGTMVAGPFVDGLYRLTLFRDALPLMSEQLEIVESNGTETVAKPASEPKAAAMIREDVLTVILTSDALLNLGKTMVQHAEKQLTAE